MPLDGSAWGEAPLNALHTLPTIGPPGADLLLVRIVETLGYALWGKNYAHVAVDEARLQADALSYLTGVSARLAERGYTPRVEVVAARSAEAIANVARDRGVDLIAMATRGRSGLARAVLGSVATATVQRADVPILLVRPAEAKPHAPAVEPISVEAGSVNTILTGGERELVAAGLQSLLADPGHDEDAAMPIRALLSRIVEAHSDAPKQPVVTTI